MTALPASAKPVHGWPEYAITPTGQVWRVKPEPRIDARRGPVPRIVKPVMMGSKRHKRSPAVSLSAPGVIVSRTVRSLVREHFG